MKSRISSFTTPVFCGEAKSPMFRKSLIKLKDVHKICLRLRSELPFIQLYNYTIIQKYRRIYTKQHLVISILIHCCLIPKTAVLYFCINVSRSELFIQLYNYTVIQKYSVFLYKHPSFIQLYKTFDFGHHHSCQNFVIVMMMAVD